MRKSMIKGMITPLVTPFHRSKGQPINVTATEQIVDHLIERGIDGLFLLGSNGEFHVLTQKEKVDFAKYVIKYVDGRIPVYVGTGACSTKEAVELSKKMEEIGADACSVLAPYFFQPTEDELYDYFHTIAKSIEIPIILYNIPKTVGYNLSSLLVEKLARVPNIQGIKDSSGDVAILQGYIDATEDTNVSVLVGSDSKITTAYAMGAKGAVAGTSNLLTDTLVGLHRALMEKDQEKGMFYQDEIEHLRKVLKLGTVPSVLKRSMELAGISEVGPARFPVNEVSEETDKQILAMLDKVQLRKQGENGC